MVANEVTEPAMTIEFVPPNVFQIQSCVEVNFCLTNI